jgi:hypothetical protein
LILRVIHFAFKRFPLRTIELFEAKGKPAGRKTRATRPSQLGSIECIALGRQHLDCPSLPGHSRSKNGVASLAYSRSKNGVASLAYDPAIGHLRKNDENRHRPSTSSARSGRGHTDRFHPNENHCDGAQAGQDGDHDDREGGEAEAAAAFGFGHGVCRRMEVPSAAL